MSGPIPIPRLDPAPGMQWVTLTVGMSQADLGDFRLVPATVEPGQDGVAGDRVEVDPDTAARWIAAGAAVAETPPEPPP